VAEPSGSFFSYEPPMANEFGNEPNAGYNPFYHLEIYIQSI